MRTEKFRSEAEGTKGSLSFLVGETIDILEDVAYEFGRERVEVAGRHLRVSFRDVFQGSSEEASEKMSIRFQSLSRDSTKDIRVEATESSVSSVTILLSLEESEREGSEDEEEEFEGERRSEGE